MKRTQIRLQYGRARTELLPILRGRAFHVTCRRNLSGILQASAVLPNDAGALKTTFGSSGNSFFRNRGCVSVIDYRTIAEDELEHALMGCSPWQPADDCALELAFLFLDAASRSQLRPWTEWKSSESFSEMVEPYAEAGYSGPLSLDAIEEILEVTFEPGEEHPFLPALRAAPPDRQS